MRLIQFLIDLGKTKIVSYIKIVVLGISGFFLFFIIFSLFKTTFLKAHFLEDFIEFITFKPYGMKKMFKRWKKIIRHLESDIESEYKLAVVEADDFLEEILRGMGYKGDTMQEILEKIDTLVLPNLEDIRQVHQIRNQVVYDPNYQLDLNKAKEVLDVYEEALRNLEVF